MAVSKVLIASLLVLSLMVLNEARVIQSDEARANATYKPGTSIDCGGLCGERCKSSSRPNLCKRACGSCCGECSCVPPGTYGNYEACPCYAKLTTRGNKPKCP